MAVSRADGLETVAFLLPAVFCKLSGMENYVNKWKNKIPDNGKAPIKHSSFAIISAVYHLRGRADDRVTALRGR